MLEQGQWAMTVLCETATIIEAIRNGRGVRAEQGLGEAKPIVKTPRFFDASAYVVAFGRNKPLRALPTPKRVPHLHAT